MSEWEGKSDFEIGKAVSGIVDHCGLTVYVNEERKVIYICEKCGDFEINPVYDFDPCNNPQDAWPVILDTCMTIELAHPELGQIGTNTIYNPFGTDWQCDYTDNKDCLRAAMIVYLEMNGVKPNE